MREQKAIKIFLICLLVFSLLHFGHPQQKQPKPVSIKNLKFKKLMPDLTVSFKSSLPIRPVITKQTKDLKAVVKNIGNKRATDFYVDFFLSTNRQLSLGSRLYFPPFREDVFLKEGRKFIKSLNPGESITIPAPYPIKFGKTPKIKSLYLGVVVDHQNTIHEINEKNNIAWVKYGDLIFIKANITNTYQLGYMDEFSTGDMNLIIQGSGFGNTMGNKTVRLGSYTLPVSQYDWGNTKIQAVIPSNIPYGETYSLHISENNIRISNTKSVLLKIYVEMCTRVVGNSLVHSGPVGSSVRIDGAEFGASQGNLVVRFGGVAATVTSWSTNRIDIICPNLPLGMHTVYIEKNGQNICFRDGVFEVTPN